MMRSPSDVARARLARASCVESASRASVPDRKSDESTTAWDESTTSRIVLGRIGRGAGRIGHWLPTRTAWFFQQFREDGFIKLPGVFSPTTLAVFEREFSRLTFAENPLGGVPMRERSTYGKAFIQVFNL